MPTEVAIRDALAADPAVLEGGLSLLSKEYHLPNAAGTRGFVDLLCKDRYGNFVVVELKRSNNSAARALHELFKYAELLARERGLGSERVRCILVSTVWDELLVPFSAAVRTFEYDTTGFLVTVDSSGRISASQEVAPLEATPPSHLTPVHIFLAYTTPSIRSSAWSELSYSLAEVGSTDHLGFFLDPTPVAEEHVYGLYLVLGTTAPTSALDHMREEVPDDSIEAPNHCVWEYRALCHVMANHRLAHDASAGYPDMLWYLRRESRRWQLIQVARAGIFASQGELFSDEDLFMEAAGYSGASETSFGASTSPARGASWRAARAKIDQVLFGNPEWAETMGAWLDEVARTYSIADVAVSIFNPCDVVGAIVNTVTDETSRSMPDMHAQVILNGRVERLIQGTLVWDIGADDTRLGPAFRSVYEEVWRWSVARSLGETWVFDIDLCAQTGLAYACVEFFAKRSTDISVNRG
jgi:hypothetical protein